MLCPRAGPLTKIEWGLTASFISEGGLKRGVPKALCGEAILIRFADDFVALFENQRVAERFTEALKRRLVKFGVTVASKKARL